MEDFEVQNKSATLLQRNQRRSFRKQISNTIRLQMTKMKKGNKKQPHTVLLLLSCSNITAIKPDFHFLLKDKLAIKRRKEN